MLNAGQTYFKNLALITLQDFYSMFVHFSRLCMKWLIFIRNLTASSLPAYAQSFLSEAECLPLKLIIIYVTYP